MNKNCKEITVGGFRMVYDKRGKVYEMDHPKLEIFRYKHLSKVFKRCYKKALFKSVKDVEGPILLPEDTYKRMVKDNPSIASLAEKFNCDIF